jgi:hypothetical protein
VVKWGNDQINRLDDIARETQREENQKREAERQRLADIPILNVIAGRWDDKGNTVLTASHGSKTRHANITEVTFTIIDQRQLSIIRRFDPPPRDDGGWGAPHHVDDVFFRKGTWRGSDAYCFSAKVGLHLPPGPAGDLRLAIIDPKLAGQVFTGELEILYSTGEPGILTHASVPRVTIKARAKQ